MKSLIDLDRIKVKSDLQLAQFKERFSKQLMGEREQYAKLHSQTGRQLGPHSGQRIRESKNVRPADGGEQQRQYPQGGYDDQPAGQTG
jgi:hypothetical protein